jgi:glutaryl-CoA dehydrogenase/cyclohexanecarboxylate-CoA ligase
MYWETTLTNAQIRRHTEAGTWPSPPLYSCLCRHASAAPERIAVVDGRHRLTYAQLVALVDRLAMGLLELGVGRHDCVSLQLPNWAEFLIAALATERAGAVVNPISTIMRERELRQMLVSGRTRVLIVPDEFRGFRHGELAVELREECPELETVLVIGAAPPAPALSWDELLERWPAERIDTRALDLLALDPNDVALLSFTSGTTGEPKGVMHTSSTMGALVASTVRRQALGPDTRVLMASPLGHGVGYYWGVRMPITVGAQVTYQATWKPDEALKLIEEARITFTMGSTAFVADLIDAAKRRPRDTASLRTLMCGGASIPPIVVRRALDTLGCRVLPCFGMTENGVCTACDQDTPLAKLVSTDGSPQPEIEIRILTADGLEARPSETGRLLMRGPFLFVGYSQGREFTSTFLDEDGWFDTGDLAFLDEDGYLRISGRTKDLIIRGGENIPVKEIEDALSEHLDVAEVALVAVPDDRFGERACACIVCRPGATVDLEGVRALLARRRVAKQFWPEFVELYDELPRTPAGKVQKFRLRAELGARRRSMDTVAEP